MIGEPERREAVAGKMPRRATDIVEDAVAWLVGSAALVLVLAALIAAVSVHGQVAERGRAEASERTAATAVLLESASVTVLEIGYQPAVDVEARWTGPDGTTRIGPVPVKGPRPAGAEVRVWLDADGAVADPPKTSFEAIATGLMTGFWLLAGGAGVLVLGWLLARRATSRANARRWEREWAAVGPSWSGKQ